MPRRSGDRVARVRASTQAGAEAGTAAGRRAEESRTGDELPGAAGRRRQDEAFVLRGHGRARSVRRRASFRCRRTREPATLTFDLHNLHTYSEEQVKAIARYARYTATIGVLTLDNTLISRAVVQNEFRAAADLVDRVGGGAGPGGVKAVAPTGTESITVRDSGRRALGQPAGRKAGRRTDRWRGDLLAAGPADRRRQQRDAGIQAGAAAEGGQEDSRGLGQVGQVGRSGRCRAGG